MKTALVPAGLAAGSLFAFQAFAASGTHEPSQSFGPTASDRAICNPIFSRLEKAESGTLMAQADTQKQSSEKKKGEKPDEEKLATQLSDMLQACSYDGKALKIDAAALKTSAEAEGMAAVSRIMRFTGLPQNFTIMESDVPNAAAIIVMGKDGIPKRVIAYNRTFMQQVAQATGEAGWPGTSILAHEIGHHLSGHTLLPGGSQPPIELEADKFSGFVLFKMGASLAEAEKAIATLIPEADGPTHPGRKKRLAAIKAGWAQSCEQQQKNCGDDQVIAAAEARSPSLPPQVEPQSTAPVRAPVATAPSAPASSVPMTGSSAPVAASSEAAAVPMPKIPGPLDIDMPSPGGSGQEIGPAVIDRIPKLTADATPSKFDRFVYDEVGVFDPDVREKLQTIAFQLAAAANVEVVTVVAKDLQGRDPDQYALDFMRQMRVGKLDVGNGAVLVVAPEAKRVGVALGPGLRILFENDDSPRKRLADYLKLVAGGGQPQKVSSTIAGAAYRVMRQAQALEWYVRYPSFETYQVADRKVFEERRKATTPYDPAKDPVANKLLRLDAVIVSRAPDVRDRKLMINEPRSRYVGPAMQVRTPDGRDIVLYVNRAVPELMPVPLEEGKRYAFVARDTILKTGAPQLDLISYDRLD
ncbi:TPM domain-containing protein [Neorhizobium alkalisoli]|uniref:TLP18.3/Psb32/MOLO-1 phosphatase superfamily protein n=1 Tax=Neorhizobium alkalisoli TaxID=528178 RepID=A0A561QBC9_9HYPH|nr:TPM domain-containing protein [Neorhizobium alkalisoli]TWF47653.1 TLP18.3/Psb32/MOLO-1 phosphatase superfamily protein [Neorhizobium alkalisoli]